MHFRGGTYGLNLATDQEQVLALFYKDFLMMYFIWFDQGLKSRPTHWDLVCSITRWFMRIGCTTCWPTGRGSSAACTTCATRPLPRRGTPLTSSSGWQTTPTTLGSNLCGTRGSSWNRSWCQGSWISLTSGGVLLASKCHTLKTLPGINTINLFLR